MIAVVRALWRGVSGRGVLRSEKKRRLGNANRNVQGRCLLHGHDMGKTQDHRNSVEQWLAVGGGWLLVVGGGWRLVVVGG